MVGRQESERDERHATLSNYVNFYKGGSQLRITCFVNISVRSATFGDGCPINIAEYL